MRDVFRPQSPVVTRVSRVTRYRSHVCMQACACRRVHAHTAQARNGVTHVTTRVCGVTRHVTRAHTPSTDQPFEKERRMNREEHEAAIEAAVIDRKAIERQHRGQWGWHAISQADAEQAVSQGEHAWLRVRPSATTTSAADAGRPVAALAQQPHPPGGTPRGVSRRGNSAPVLAPVAGRADWLNSARGG